MKIVLGVYDEKPHPFHYRWIDDSWVLSDIDPRHPNIMKVDARDIQIDNLEAIYASHIVEHVSIDEVPKMLKHWHEKLVPGGEVIINVPDMQWLSDELSRVESGLPAQSEYFDTVDKLMFVIYGPGEGFDQHKSGFTKSTLYQKLADAGFVNITIDREYEAHEMMCLIASAHKPL